VGNPIRRVKRTNRDQRGTVRRSTPRRAALHRSIRPLGEDDGPARHSSLVGRRDPRLAAHRPKPLNGRREFGALSGTEPGQPPRASAATENSPHGQPSTTTQVTLGPQSATFAGCWQTGHTRASTGRSVCWRRRRALPRIILNDEPDDRRVNESSGCCYQDGGQAKCVRASCSTITGSSANSGPSQRAHRGPAHIWRASVGLHVRLSLRAR
jgi:hypothetical protein